MRRVDGRGGEKPSTDDVVLAVGWKRTSCSLFVRSGQSVMIKRAHWTVDDDKESSEQKASSLAQLIFPSPTLFLPRFPIATTWSMASRPPLAHTKVNSPTSPRCLNNRKPNSVSSLVNMVRTGTSPASGYPFVHALFFWARACALGMGTALSEFDR